MVFRADLHIHSHHSDGHWSPEQIVNEAKLRGIQALSITDHDTLKAYPETNELAKQANIQLIPGIELSSFFNETTVHVLGYGFDLQSTVLQQPLEDLAKARTDRIKHIIERLNKRHLKITFDDLTQAYPQTLLARPHIAKVLVDKGYATSIEKAFDDYLNDNKMGSLKLKSLTTDEAIELIHQAGGYAVLAHPHQIKQQKKLRAILALPFDGLEAYYSTHHSKVDTFLALAHKHGLFATGGSDFHYPKAYQPLGCSFTPEDTFQLIYKRTLETNHLDVNLV